MKVINWLFGSFFRTIGRTIAILLMGGLLYYILASNGIGISDLFLDSVKASTIKNYNTSWYSNNGSQYSSTMYSPGGNFYGRSISRYANTSVSGTMNYRFNSNGSSISLDNNPTAIYIQLFFYATGPSVNSQEGGTIDGIYYYNNDISNNINIETYVYSQWSNCQVVGNNGSVWTYKCPLQTNSPYISGLNLKYYFDEKQADDTGSLYFIGISSNYSIEYDNQAAIVEQQQQTNEAIANQTQQQQQQHEEVMDDNTTQAESEGESFFGNFTTEDHGGLNSIITAPLNTIRSLLNSSCTKLTLPLPFVNKNLELPCMNDIYTEHFGLFFSLYQTIILAIISYRCLRSIFFDITGFTNPDDDRIEVMDL